MTSAAEVFAAMDAATAALETLTDATPADERARIELSHREATSAMFDLL